MAVATLPAQLRNRDRARLDAYKKHLDFYNGKQWPTAQRLRNPRRLTFNYARPIVHKTTAALMAGRTVLVEPDDDSDATTARAAEAELAINQVWDQNAAPALDFDTELDCAVLGDAAYKVWWSDTEHRVRISAPDPANIFKWTWPDDPSRAWRIANRYTLNAADAEPLFPGATVKASNTIIEAWTLDTYERWLNDTMLETRKNPYPFIPFVIFPNVRDPQQVWGTSDLASLLDTFTELNRELSQLSLIMEVSGNPIAVLEGMDEAQDIAVTPGAVWEIPKDTKAYLLDLLAGGGVRLHSDYLAALYRTMYDLAETPRSAFGDNTRDLSGVALELELDPLLKKVERKRIIRTQAYTDRNTMILSLLDQFTGTAFGAVNHTIHWGSVLPTDRDREVTNELAAVAAGVHSRRFAADALGGVDNADAQFNQWLDEQRAIANTSPQ